MSPCGRLESHHLAAPHAGADRRALRPKMSTTLRTTETSKTTSNPCPMLNLAPMGTSPATTEEGSNPFQASKPRAPARGKAGPRRPAFSAPFAGLKARKTRLGKSSMARAADCGADKIQDAAVNACQMARDNRFQRHWRRQRNRSGSATLRSDDDANPRQLLRFRLHLLKPLRRQPNRSKPPHSRRQALPSSETRGCPSLMTLAASQHDQ